MKFITKEMVDDAIKYMNEIGMDSLFKEMLGEIPEDKPIEAFEELHNNAVIQALFGNGDPVTTVTAGFAVGFIVARKNFNGS